MIIWSAKAQGTNNKIPRRGSYIQASNDGVNWQHLYFIQLDTDENKPFVCVEMERDIHFPALRGKKFSMLKWHEYEVCDIILFEKKFITRDQLYESKMEPNSRNYYWDFSSQAKKAGAGTLFVNKLRDTLDVNIRGVEKAVEILNNII